MNSQTNSATVDYELTNGDFSDQKNGKFVQKHNAAAMSAASSESDVSSPPTEYSTNHGLSNVMQVMNKLSDIFNRLRPEGQGDINLPKIVMFGSQSSGKTSVLESITGEELLPRGVGTQTRCPIELRLVHKKGGRKWVEFIHAPSKYDKQYTDMAEVKKVIQEMTEEIKRNEEISEKPIIIRICSPDVVDLTLVDLPGLQEVPRDDQPADLGIRIEKLCDTYIRNPNSIILAVTAANMDIVNTKCFRLARQADPEGSRTLGVLTKLDLMEEGLDASEELTGKKIKFKLGIIGVVNRSYKETQEGKTVPEGLAKEKAFLEKAYPTLATRNGTPYLINRISDQLLKRISETLPGVKGKVGQLIEQYKQRLHSLGSVEEPGEMRKTFIAYIKNFERDYCSQVDGRRRDLNTAQLSTSAKIQHTYEQLFYTELDNLTAGQETTDFEIDCAIFNSHALHSMERSCDDAFQEFARREISRIQPIVMNCAEQVYEEMLTAIGTSSNSEASTKYPKLNNNIARVVTDLVNERFKTCNNYLDDFLGAEAALIKTCKPEFLDRKQKPTLPERLSTGSAGSATGNPFSDDEAQGTAAVHRMTVEPQTKDHRTKVRDLVSCYFNLLKTDIKDHVPKAITFKLVYGVIKKLDEVLTDILNTPEGVKTLMQESDTLIRERNSTNKMLKEYEEAEADIDFILETAQI